MKLKLLVLLLFSLPVLSQTIDSTLIELNPIKIYSGKLASEDLNSPMAISVIPKAELQTASQQLSIFENLQTTAGVYATNPYNFSADTRISIRGFGSQAAFGINGIRIFVDDIPESTPDGQAEVDNIVFSNIEQIEIIRGPTSNLYGNGSGGAINLYTEVPTNKTLKVESKISAGSFGFKGLDLKLSQSLNKVQYLISGTSKQIKGYRDQSSFKQHLFNSKVTYNFNKKNSLTSYINFSNSPEAYDPGGVNLEDMLATPKAASTNNLKYSTGEKINASKVALAYKAEKLNIRTYFLGKTLNNRLPIANSGIGFLKRKVWGLNADYLLKKSLKYQLKFGIDASNQNDHRERYTYSQDLNQGNLVIDQNETYGTAAALITQQVNLKKAIFRLGLRHDLMQAKLKEDYINNNKSSYFAGASYEYSPNNFVYVNSANTFDNPTLNEYTSNPESVFGFNTNLISATGISNEIGFKGRVNRLKYDLALFNIDTKNELIPYEIEAFPGKSFFKNAGKTNRKGIEVNTAVSIAKGIFLNTNYAYSNFSYSNYIVDQVNLNGNLLPGIPKHYAQSSVNYQSQNGFFLKLQAIYNGKLYVNDLNTELAKAYTLLNAKALKTIELNHAIIEPYISINNIGNTVYSGNIKINAFGGRYYEAAPPINVFGGLKLIFN